MNLAVTIDHDEEIHTDFIAREKRSSGLMSPGSELLTESSALRIHNLFADEILSKEQRDILKAQIDVKNTEVMRDLCLLADEKVCTLADDLLFQANSFTNIDGAGGSTWYALRTTGENNPESPKRPLSLRRQLSLKRNSWLGAVQDNREVAANEENLETKATPQLSNETKLPQPVMKTTRTKSATKVFTAEDYFHRLKDKNQRMGNFQNAHNGPNHEQSPHSHSQQQKSKSDPPPRTKRATDIPVYVVKKNRPKVEQITTTSPTPPLPTPALPTPTSPPSTRSSLPIQMSTNRDRPKNQESTSNSSANKSNNGKTSISKEAPKKTGFLAGITNLFKKKPLVTPKNENHVVNTSDEDQFEFNVPPIPKATSTNQSLSQCQSRASKVENDTLCPPTSVDTGDGSDGVGCNDESSQTQFDASQSSLGQIIIENEIVSHDHHIDPTSSSSPVDLVEQPIWEIFSKGPGSPTFECSNLNPIQEQDSSVVSTRSSQDASNNQKLEKIQTKQNHMENDSIIRSTTDSFEIGNEERHHLRQHQQQQQQKQQQQSSPKHQQQQPQQQSPDPDENEMEVWECYQTNDDTDSGDNLRERKITWLFSNGNQVPQEFQVDKRTDETIKEESEKPLLPYLFGHLINATSPSKKEYSKFYKKPLEIRVSAMKKPKVVNTKIVKHVSYSTIEIRFYNYTIGQGIPSDGGPSLGLNWEFDQSSTMLVDLECFEEFRGGIVPDDADDDEEWNDNWRIPREYFLDAGGRLTPEMRIKNLKSAGHRRSSIDLSSYLCRQDMASRVKNSRSRAARLLIDGTDPDEVMVMQQEWEARQVIEPYIMQWMQKRRLRS